MQQAIPVGGGLANMEGLDNTLLDVDITWQAEGGEDIGPATDLDILHCT